MKEMNTHPSHHTMTSSTLLVKNIHCPSCVSHITHILGTFPSINQETINVSIIQGIVSFTHQQDNQDIDLNAISHALSDAGFEIDHDREPFHFCRFMQDRKRKRRHQEICVGCQLSRKGSVELNTLSETNEKVQFNSTTRLQVSGMSCSACVNAIQDALLNHEGVQFANVSLISNTVDIVHNPKVHVDTLKNIIENIGYDASFNDSDDLTQVVLVSEDQKPINARLSIGGMTCASCVNSINDVVKDIAGVQSFAIDLTSGMASVLTIDQDRIQEIVEKINDIGYEAAIVEIIQPDKLDNFARTVKIKVIGMFCLQCPRKISNSLRLLSPNIISVIEATLEEAIITVTYIPKDPPLFTIRTILDAISNLGFEAEIQRPPSLEDRIQKLQHREQKTFLFRFLFSLIFTIPTFIISIVFTQLLPQDHSLRMYFEQPIWGGASRMIIALFILATPVQFIIGWPFYTASWKSLRGVYRRKNLIWWKKIIRWGSMDLLVALGTTAAYISSLGLMITEIKGSGSNVSKMTYFDTSVFLIMFITLGRYLEAVSKQRTGDAVRALGALRPQNACLYDVITQTSKSIPVELLEVGDIIQIQSNSHVAADCIVYEGVSTFNESSLTGESLPVTKKKGDMIFAGTRNQSNSIIAKVSAISNVSNGGTLLDSIIKMVREAQTRKAPVEKVADLVTGYFVPCIVFLSILTFIIWVSLGESGILPSDWLDIPEGGWSIWALEFAVAVLVIACPCGIGLAAPTAQMVGTGLAAQYGILAQGGGEALQLASSIQTVVFDKTGTITQGGEPNVTNEKIISEKKITRGKLLKAISIVESSSTHPLAIGLCKYCEKFTESEEILGNLHIESSEEKIGYGIITQIKIDDQNMQLALGNLSLMKHLNITISEEILNLVTNWQDEAKTVIYVSCSNELTAIFALSDVIRPEATTIISYLQTAKIDVWLLSGDNIKTAKAVAKQVGINHENVIADVLPTQKANEIKKLQFQNEKRRIVMMIGDGINDAPALSQSDVGVAIGSGSTIAISAAHFILLSSDLGNIKTLLELSTVVLRRIKMNFIWALCYNVIGIPIAAGIIYPAPGHPRLPPVWASLAMALSSVSVVISSLALRLWKPKTNNFENKSR